MHQALLLEYLRYFGSEVTKTLSSLGYILIIIIIHSIIKSISEGMGNNEIGQITYYVQYILNNLVRLYKLFTTNTSGTYDDNSEISLQHQLFNQFFCLS